MADKAPWWAGMTEDERERMFAEEMEGWHERFAEAGSGHVFGGGNPADAGLIAGWAAGGKPRREDFGLEPEPVAPAKPAWVPDEGEEFPF